MAAILRIKQADGTWAEVPALVGSKGDKGDKGDRGDRGLQGDRGLRGERGDKGDKGDRGDAGVHIGADAPPDNVNIWIDPNGEPTSVEDWEFDLDDGSSDTKTVVVVDSDDASAGGKAAILRVRQADGTFVEIPALVGAKGDKGDKGDRGEAGTGVTILGSYETEAALKAAHPTGKAGDGYLVNGNLYVWSETASAWDNVGNIKGPKGDPGYTPVKGTDYFDGKDGVNGKDGYTPQKGVDYFDGKNGQDGVSVTIESVNESTADGGNNVVTFSDGNTVTIKNGSKGGKGNDGYTPQRGIDYWTAADKAAIVDSVKASTTPSDIGAADANTHNIKTYTVLSQLGLTDGATMNQVANALPSGSVFRTYIMTSANANLAPAATNGWLEVHRPNVNHVIFQYTASSLKRYIAHVLNVGQDGESVSSWSKLAAQSDIDSHTQAASTVKAGTFAGQVVANASGQAAGTSLLRNSKLVSTETNPTVNGEINWTYE